MMTTVCIWSTGSLFAAEADDDERDDGAAEGRGRRASQLLAVISDIVNVCRHRKNNNNAT